MKQKQLKRKGTKQKEMEGGREGEGRRRGLRSRHHQSARSRAAVPASCRPGPCTRRGTSGLRKYRRLASKGLSLPKFTGLQFSVNRWCSP